MTSPLIRDSLTLRLRLLLGAVVDLIGEEAATGGRRVFLGRGRQDLPSGAPTRRLVLHPLPPDGPTGVALQHRADLLLVLTHPAIAAPIATGEFEGRAWVVEPIPPGTPLSAHLMTRGSLSVREAVAILRDVARALTALHRRGMVHGALSTTAVHLDRRGTVLTGFGIATTGSVAEDLRALGRLGWEMLVGPVPDGASGRPLRAHRPSAPVELEQLIEGLLAKDGAPPRPTRAAEALDALDRFPAISPSTITNFFGGVAGGGRRVRRSTRWLTGAAGAAGGLLGRFRGR